MFGDIEEIRVGCATVIAATDDNFVTESVNRFCRTKYVFLNE